MGSASTDEREQGFIDTMKKEFPKVVFLSDDQYAGATSDLAQQKSQNLLTRFRGQFDGVFCSERVERGGDAPGARRGRDAGEEALSGPLLAMRDVAKRFGASRALDGVSLDLEAGEVLALLGENGAGKSTLMKILSGAYRPDSGSMTLGGEPYSPSGPRDALARGVAMIYQELTIAPHLTVEANVMLGQERTRAGLDPPLGPSSGSSPRPWRRSTIPTSGSTRRPGALSVGAQQLIEVARALVSNARVIVFDEPTSSLTERDAARLFEVIDRLRARGLAIVYISHFLEEVQRVAQRYVVLRDGRSVGSGRLADASLSDDHRPDGRPRADGAVPEDPPRRRASRSSTCPASRGGSCRGGST